MVKDLVDLEDTAIRREEVRTSLGLHGAVVGRGGSRMRKGGDNAVELAALEFETHPSCVKFLEIEVSTVQVKIDAQEIAGVSNPNVKPPCQTADR